MAVLGTVNFPASSWVRAGRWRLSSTVRMSVFTSRDGISYERPRIDTWTSGWMEVVSGGQIYAVSGVVYYRQATHYIGYDGGNFRPATVEAGSRVAVEEAARRRTAAAFRYGDGSYPGAGVVPDVVDPSGPANTFPAGTDDAINHRRVDVRDFRVDLRYVDTVRSDLLSTANVTPGRSRNVRTDGVVRDTVGELVLHESVNIGSGSVRSAGTLLNGPDEVGTAKTVYRVIGQLWSGHFLEVGVGRGPLAPTASDAGNPVTNCVAIGGTVGRVLVIDEMFALEPFGSDHPVCVYVSAYGAGSAQDVRGSLSVQRLVHAPPPALNRSIN